MGGMRSWCWGCICFRVRSFSYACWGSYVILELLLSVKKWAHRFSGLAAVSSILPSLMVLLYSCQVFVRVKMRAKALAVARFNLPLGVFFYSSDLFNAEYGSSWQFFTVGRETYAVFGLSMVGWNYFVLRLCHFKSCSVSGKLPDWRSEK